MNPSFKVIVPYESNYESSFLDKLDAIRHVGLDMNDVIREAVRIAVAVIDFQNQNEIVCHIDYIDVEAGVDAIVGDSELYNKFSTIVWEAFTDCVWSVYAEVYPHLRAFIDSTGVRPINSGGGYRCEDVIVDMVQSGHDHFVVSFRLIIQSNVPVTLPTAGFISSV